ncbi:MAG: molybdopterin-guanine dinucleotide biosynthesis protein A [Chloroflexi bacterium]|nr:MAG: molybdopterin-guanine dinucleotide biosynthesis protein A [Chloroflexota bacterium]
MAKPDPPPVEPFSGIILAGGFGTRLGCDKADAQAAGRSLLHWTADALAAATDDIVVVARPGQSLPPPDGMTWRVVTDTRADAGPLAGIEAGLADVQHELAVVVATDMPLLAPALVRAIAHACRDVDVAMPLRDGRPEPLLAAYRRHCQSIVSALLDTGERRPRRLLDQARSRRIDAQELRPHDPDLASFRNVNTPADLAAVARLLVPPHPPALTISDPIGGSR